MIDFEVKGRYFEWYYLDVDGGTRLSKKSIQPSQPRLARARKDTENG